MALKRPNMSSNTSKRRCCSGANKDKLYEKDDPCTSDDLTFSEQLCDCVECTGDRDCLEKGYSSCYICVNNECVPGPKCCSSLPGKQQALECGGPVTETTCCQYDVQHYLLEAPGGTCYSAARWAGQPSDSRNCWSSGVSESAMYVSTVECEDLYFLITTSTVGPSWDTNICKEGEVKSPLPSGSYVDNTRWRLFAVGPAGSVPINGIRNDYADDLEAVTGVPSNIGGYMSRGYEGPCASGAYGTIGPNLNLPGINDAYYGGGYCIGAQQPTVSKFKQCGSHGPCACTGQQYKDLLEGRSAPRSCRQCGGFGQWVLSGYGNCYTIA